MNKETWPRVLGVAAAIGLLAGCGNERRGGAEDFKTPGPAEGSPPSLQPGEVYDRGAATKEPATNASEKRP